MQKLSPLVLAMGAFSFAAVPVQFTAGTSAKADEVNRNFNYLDSAKAAKSSVDLLTSAMVAKIDASEANTKLGAKVDTGAYNKYTREQAAKSVVDTSAKRRIDSLAVATKSGDEGLGKRMNTLENAPAAIANDTAGIKEWTSKYFPGTVSVAGIKGQGTTDFGAATFMRREPGSGSSVLDFHTDGVINSWKTEGGLQTNSVTRIDGNGNGFLSTLRVGLVESKSGSPASFVSTGVDWCQGPEIIPADTKGLAGLLFRQIPNETKGSVGIFRHPDGGLYVAFRDLTGMVGTVDGSSSFSLSAKGEAAFGSTLSVHGKLLAQSASVTDLRVAGALKTAPTEPWADYVFEPGYKAMALKDVESFAKANGHLPEVPSAAEVQKDGIDLAKMNAILLKKIEELTLHAVAQEKRMEALSAKVEALEAERK